MFPIDLWSKDQRSSALDICIKVEIRFPGSRMLPFPPRVTISYVWITHERKMFPIEIEVKGQRSSAFDIKVEVRFPDSRMLPFPPTVTMSHIWTTHWKMFPMEVWVKWSSILDTKVEIWFPGSIVMLSTKRDHITYGLPMGERCSLSKRTRHQNRNTVSGL
jgi:hypothetical protein